MYTAQGEIRNSANTGTQDILFLLASRKRLHRSKSLLDQAKRPLRTEVKTVYLKLKL